MMPTEIPELYMKAWADFKDRVEYRDRRETEVYSFPQTWGDTTCGHGGIGGQSITTTQTHVFNAGTKGWFVYQGGEFSYHVKDPSDQFYNDLRDWNLVGETDYEDASYERGNN